MERPIEGYQSQAAMAYDWPGFVTSPGRNFNHRPFLDRHTNHANDDSAGERSSPAPTPGVSWRSAHVYLFQYGDRSFSDSCFGYTAGVRVRQGSGDTNFADLHPLADVNAATLEPCEVFTPVPGSRKSNLRKVWRQWRLWKICIKDPVPEGQEDRPVAAVDGKGCSSAFRQRVAGLVLALARPAK